jgi:putative salt-induced outer membrane protein YdiY
VVLLALVLVSLRASAKSKDDTVVMSNGDNFTGEIKGLQNGELEFKADYMRESVYLDWKRVKLLQSKDSYIVGLTDGRRVTGRLQQINPVSQASPAFELKSAERAGTIAPSEVITLQQREASVWDQLTGSVNYGFSFASENMSTNSSLGADVEFAAATNAVQLATSSQFDSQKNAVNTSRFTFDSEYNRTLSPRWVASGLFSLLKSNQQSLNLRSTFGAALGRKLVQTNRTALLAIAGVAYSHENYVPQSGTQPIRSNGEALLGIQLSTFHFKTFNLNSHTFLFPSLTEIGRFRISSQSNVRIELVRNFYWSFQVYENYDARPPVTAPKNDLGLTTSVGLTF